MSGRHDLKKLHLDLTSIRDELYARAALRHVVHTLATLAPAQLTSLKIDMSLAVAGTHLLHGQGPVILGTSVEQNFRQLDELVAQQTSLMDVSIRMDLCYFADEEDDPLYRRVDPLTAYPTAREYIQHLLPRLTRRGGLKLTALSYFYPEDSDSDSSSDDSWNS